jgi:hypothetical protein
MHTQQHRERSASFHQRPELLRPAKHFCLSGGFAYAVGPATLIHRPTLR